MIASTTDVTWMQAGLWIGGLLAAGFAVSWLLTDVGKMRRTPYILWLTVVTGVVTAGYLVATGVDAVELVRHNAGWGVLGGVVVAVPLYLGLRKVGPANPGHPSTTTVAWEGFVYGMAEGVLLSALPALIVWQAADSAGWADSVLITGATWVLALVASTAVIVVHHLGYWDFRNRHIVPAIVACGALTLAFLATGSVLAPVVGHVLLHTAGLMRGVELPPHVAPARRSRQVVHA